MQLLKGCENEPSRLGRGARAATWGISRDAGSSFRVPRIRLSNVGT